MEEKTNYGYLGTQYCIKSKEAFSRLKHINTEKVGSEYEFKYSERITKSNLRISKEVDERFNMSEEGTLKIKGTFNGIVKDL